MLVVDKMDPSIKEQIDREYKEIDECKKGFKKEKKNDKAKMVSTEHKFTSTRNEAIISTDTAFKWFNIQSRITNGKIPIISKLVLSFGFYFCHQLRC